MTAPTKAKVCVVPLDMASKDYAEQLSTQYFDGRVDARFARGQLTLGKLSQQQAHIHGNDVMVTVGRAPHDEDKSKDLVTWVRLYDNGRWSPPVAVLHKELVAYIEGRGDTRGLSARLNQALAAPRSRQPERQERAPRRRSRSRSPLRATRRSRSRSRSPRPTAHNRGPPAHVAVSEPQMVPPVPSAMFVTWRLTATGQGRDDCAAARIV